jgi:NitT/TauT family transport system permease protein
MNAQAAIARDPIGEPIAAPAKASVGSRIADRLAPILGGIVALLAWEGAVRFFHVSKFVLPPPSLIFAQLVSGFGDLMFALAFTATITLSAFALATISGVLVGVLLTQNPRVERMLWPYAVALQVTPMVAIAPLVVIWVGLDNVWLALMILAWVVAFFPILSNTMIGMKSADHGLRNLFSLYRASRTKRFFYLQLPSALPYILAGMRVSAGLSVIGAVVAEFVAGSGSATGLAWTIVSSGTMLDIPKMFAALIVLAAFGLLMNGAVALIQKLLLGAWHESAIRQEN